MKPETRYALFVLALSVIWKLILFIGKWEDSWAGKYPLLPVLGFLLLGIFKGMDERRKLSFPTGIRFADAFKIGLSINALFALMYTLFIYVYISRIDTAFEYRFVLNRVRELQKENTPQADIDAWVKSSQDFPFTVFWVVFTLIGLIFIGMFYSAMIARTMARKHPTVATN